MQTFKSFVSEIKSTVSKDEWDWTTKSTRDWQARWPKLDIDITFSQSGGIRLEDKFFAVWSADFTRGGAWDITGEGNAEEIFAWVIERALEFMKSKPDIVRFTADKGETSRGKFYDTMTKIITKKVKSHTWFQIDDSKHKGKKGKPYFIVKDELLDYSELEDELVRYNDNFA